MKYVIAAAALMLATASAQAQGIYIPGTVYVPPPAPIAPQPNPPQCGCVYNGGRCIMVCR